MLYSLCPWGNHTYFGGMCLNFRIKKGKSTNKNFNNFWKARCGVFKKCEAQYVENKNQTAKKFVKNGEK